MHFGHSGTLGIGTTGPAATLQVNGTAIIGGGSAAYAKQVGPLEVNKSGNWAGAAFNTWQTSNRGSILELNKSESATIGTHTIVSTDDEIGGILFHGSDGTAWRQAASIYAYSDGTPGSEDMPGRLVFNVTPDNSATPTERMRITNAGNVG
ncbi:MAG: hypothetical protein Q7R49_06255, partial [Candidatus Daviesbacteria bacterium]|nr:hypothetical protein [Candidatus Daviesbacteria bacterium]